MKHFKICFFHHCLQDVARLAECLVLIQSLGTEFEKAFALKLKWAKNIQNGFCGTYVYKLWLQYLITDMSLVLQNRWKHKESNVFLSGW